MIPGVEISAEMKARILASVGSSPPSATRRTTLRLTGILVLSAAVLAGCLYFALGGMSHGQGRPPAVFAASMSVWVAAALVSLWIAVGTGRTPMGRPRPWLFAAAIGTPIVVMLLMLSLSAALPVDDATQLALHRPSAACFGMTLAAGVVPVIALIIVRRESDPAHPALHGAAIGVAFGSYAGIMVCLWCPDVAPAHIALGHVAPIVLLALLGAALGARVLDMRGDGRTADR